MEKETILFFQELYQYSISRSKILSFCKEKQHADMQKSATFMNQILIGDEACSIEKEYKYLMDKVHMICEPEDILGIQVSFESLVSKANKYMFDSMQAIDKSVFMPEEIKVLHPLFEKYATEKVHKMISLSLYYLLCQCGLDIQKIVKSYLDDQTFDLSNIVSCIRLYSEMSELINRGTIEQWKYILKQVELDKLGKMPQFFVDCATPVNKSNISGKPMVYYATESSAPVYIVEGKGYITNLDLKTDSIIDILVDSKRLLSADDLTLKHNDIWDLEFASSPIEVLNIYFDGKPFVISAQEYFRFANICMLFQRVRLIFGD